MGKKKAIVLITVYGLKKTGSMKEFKRERKHKSSKGKGSITKRRALREAKTQKKEGGMGQ